MQDGGTIVANEESPTRHDPASLVEVVMSVGFNCLPASALVHFATFWQSALADTFPRVEEKAPYSLDDAFSLPFGLDRTAASDRRRDEGGFADPHCESGQDQPAQRLWFLNEAGDELLQLQRNWFAGNWRRITIQEQRIDWSTRRELFIGWLRSLDSYLAETGVGHLAPRQYEVTYVSHIHASEEWKHHGEFHKVFRSAGLDDLPRYLRRESVRLHQEFLILGRDGPAVGRLRVNARPGYTADSRAPVYVLELTARGTPRPLPRWDRIADLLDTGRSAILDVMTAIAVEADPSGVESAQPGPGTDDAQDDLLTRLADRVVRPGI